MLLFFANEKAFAEILFGSCAIAVSILYACGLKYGVLWSLLYPFILGQLVKTRFNEWRFLFDGPRMIQGGYDKANGGTFVVRSPDSEHILVSSKRFIREIDAAPDSVLSLQAAAKQMIQPQYSMHKFNWFDQRGIDGTPLVRTLRNVLTNNLPYILSKSRLDNIQILDKMMNKRKKKPHVSKLIRKTVAHINALAIFGEELAQDEKFMKGAVDFAVKTIFIAEVVRLLPSFIGPRLGVFLANRLDAHKVIHETLVPVAQQRLDERERAILGHKVAQHKDCIQWVMEQMYKTQPQKPWTAERIVHELMALWFGANHSIAMTANFAIYNLCLHPEYIEPLRNELESPAYEDFEATGFGLPLLDSFLKESSRLSPVDSISTRRKALQPFHLSDGTCIERGQWICTPLRAMLRDPKNYVQPLEFHGFRHVDPAILSSLDQNRRFESPEPEKAMPMTDVTRWQTWGTGRMACPGRFYAVAAMKQIIGLIITKYDCELLEREAPSWASWRTCHVPKSSTPIVLRRRAVED